MELIFAFALFLIIIVTVECYSYFTSPIRRCKHDWMVLEESNGVVETKYVCTKCPAEYYDQSQYVTFCD